MNKPKDHPMRTVHQICAVGTVLMLGAGQVVANPVAAAKSIHGLLVEAPWARATPPGAKVGAGFLRIVNAGKTPDRLIGISSPAAKKVGLHETIMRGTISEMRPVTGGLAIPPGGTVTLAPGGYHLMFEGLKAPFRKGGHVEATLDFAKAGRIPVEFAVKGIGAGAMQGMH
jgi:hypothetical protein